MLFFAGFFFLLRYSDCLMFFCVLHLSICKIISHRATACQQRLFSLFLRIVHLQGVGGYDIITGKTRKIRGASYLSSVFGVLRVRRHPSKRQPACSFSVLRIKCRPQGGETEEITYNPRWGGYHARSYFTSGFMPPARRRNGGLL